MLASRSKPLPGKMHDLRRSPGQVAKHNVIAGSGTNAHVATVQCRAKHPPHSAAHQRDGRLKQTVGVGRAIATTQYRGASRTGRRIYGVRHSGAKVSATLFEETDAVSGCQLAKVASCGITFARWTPEFHVVRSGPQGAGKRLRQQMLVERGSALWTQPGDQPGFALTRNGRAGKDLDDNVHWSCRR